MKSLIFDIDGTLWDSRAIVAKGYNDYLLEIGRPDLQVDAEYLKTLFGKVMTEIADNLFPDFPPEVRYPLMERCMETENKYLEENPCHIGYEGIREVLAELKKKYRLFIVSNSQCGYPDLCVEKLGLQDLIEGHLCFGDTGTTKGQTILTLMRKYGIASAAYIGDTQGDLDACEEAGIDFIWAAYGFGAPAHWVAKADSPQALLEIL